MDPENPGTACSERRKIDLKEFSSVMEKNKLKSSQTSTSSMSVVTSSQVSYHHSSVEYGKANYEASNSYVLEDMAKAFNTTKSLSSPPGLPPRNFNNEQYLGDSLSIGQEQQTKLPRSPSGALMNKMEQMTKTFKGINLGSSKSSISSKGAQFSQSTKSFTTSLSSASRSTEAGPALPSRPPSVFIQKLESAWRNVPAATMLIGQNDWIRDEPMYQFYAATVNHSHVSVDGNNEEDFYDMYLEWPHWSENDDYKSIGIENAKSVEKINETNRQTVKPEQVTADEGIILTENMIARTLWCDLQVVQENSAACSLSKQQKKLQEIKFEILTTEASYIKSLNVLQDHFIKSPELSDKSVLPEDERRILFQEVKSVHGCSLAFMADLEMCWKESIFLRGIFDVIFKHCNEYFHVYIEYCAHLSGMAETYKTLLEKNSAFACAIKRLESHPDTCRLPLQSFLLMPLQRITRLLLLVEAALQCLEKKEAEYLSCQEVTKQLRQMVDDCNEGARATTRRRQRMAKLREQLDYLPGVKPFSMTSTTRWLIMSSEMTKYDVKPEEAMFTLSRNKNKLAYKITKSKVCLFLLNDLLVLTKKKSDDSFIVLDYGLRTVVRADEERNIAYLPQKLKTDAPKKYILIINIFENHENKNTEMILSCKLESDRDRWLEAMTPHTVKDIMQTKKRTPTSQKPTTNSTDISPNMSQ